ncbi:MAG: hypothetical protein O3B87_04055 [bacterium]|nr:hypothetical protein [bacterium]
MSDFYPLLVEELQYIDILYEDMEGSKEGYILPSQFNKTGTNKVYLNAHFQNEPPVFSAMVIAHEVTHILQLKNAYALDCIEKEVAAFLNQAYLYFLIDDKDRNALDEAALKFEDPSSQSIRFMAKIFDSKVKECGKENWQCWSEGLKEEVTKMVYSSEAYQKQCRTN